MRKVNGLGRVATATAAAIGLVAVTLAGQQSGSSVPPADAAAISGVVVDALTGQPLADAVVSLATGDRATSGQPNRQQTDARGRFVYPEVRGGLTYVLTASRIGYLASDETPPALARATARVTLAAGQWARDIRVALWPPASISGTVIDAHGDPVVGAYVRVLMKTVVGGRDRLAAGPIATTDDHGGYRISSLTKGAYIVSLVSVSESVPAGSTQGALNNLKPELAAGRPAQAPIVGTRAAGDGLALLLVGRHNTERDAGTAYAGQYFSGATNAAAAAPVTVDYGDERRGIDFKLQRVPAWRVSGVVRAPPGELSHLSLRLIPAGSEGLGVGSETATTQPAADGRFAFLAVPSGRYTLLAGSGVGEFRVDSRAVLLSPARLPAAQGVIGSRVAAASDPVMFARSSSAQGSSWGQRTVVVEDRNLEAVDVDVARGSSISGQIVLEPGSDPPVNRTGAVVVEPSLDNEWLMLSNFTVTEPSGGAPSWSGPRSFEIQSLTPGRYYLRTNLPTAVIKSIVSDGRDLANEPIDVSSGGDLTSVIVTITTRVPTLSGAVQATTGAPAVGAAVICFPANRNVWQKFGFNPTRTRSVAADSNGAFRFEGLPAGEYLVVAVPESQRDAWRDSQFLDAASRVAARVRLEWGATVNQTLRLETIRTR